MQSAVPNRIETYGKGFPFYLRYRRHLVARAVHYFSAGFSSFLLGYTLFAGYWAMLPLVLVAGYGPAWTGDFFFEKDRPATFICFLWLLRGDYHIFSLWGSGRLKHRLRELATDDRPALA